MQQHARPVAGLVGDNFYFTVRDHVHGAVGIAQHRAAQRHVFNGAADAGHLNHVAHVVLVFHQDEKTVEHVFHQRLCAEANRQTHDARAGQQRFYIHAESGKNPHGRHKDDDKNSHAVEHTGQGPQLQGAPAGVLAVRCRGILPLP